MTDRSLRTGLPGIPGIGLFTFRTRCAGWGSGATSGLLSLLFVSALHAQQASLLGRIEDVTGKVIAGAAVQVLNRDTGSSRRGFTDAVGFYSLPSLPPGPYDLDVSAAGFRSSMRTNLDLHVAQNARVDFTLQVGSVSQAITITDDDAPEGVYGAGGTLENGTATGGTLINKYLVSTLPLLGSNPFSLINLTGGSSHISAFPDHLSERPFDNGGMDGYSINGGPAGGNNNGYLIDGAPNNTNEGLGFVPPTEAVREVNIIKNAYDAEYGKSGGGITTVNLKSGSGLLHGTARHYFRNNILNANLTQANALGQPGSTYQWNEPGAEMDGPVRIPRISSRRHPTFFLVSWDEILDRIASSVSRIYPTAPERAGDFSRTIGASGQPVALYDPVTTTASGVRTLFTGSLLPASRIDPVMRNLLALLPVPNSTCVPRGCQNYAAVGSNSDAYDAIVTRIDHDLSASEKLFISIEHGNRHELRQNPGAPNPAAQFAFPDYGTFRANDGASVNLTSIFSPTLVSMSRVIWLRHNGLGTTGGGDGFDPAKAGLSPNLAVLFGAKNLPQFSFADSSVNYTALNSPGLASPGAYSTTYSTNWSASNALIRTRPGQTWKIGGLITTTLQNNYAKSTIPGITFGDVFTRANYLQADPNSGDAIATMLLGYPTASSYTKPILTALATKYYALFIQDDWRVSNSLTMSLGLRWDYQSPPTERYNRAVIGFDPTALSIIGGVPVHGGLQFASPDHRSPYTSRANNIQPRLGIAWAISKKVVFRGGWGRSYVQGYPFAPTTGFASTTSIMASPDGTNRVPTLAGDPSSPFPGLSANGFAQLYGSGLASSAGSSLGALAGAGTSVSFIDPDYKNAYVDSFNAGFDYHLPWRMLVHAEYNGSRGHRIAASGKPLNVLPVARFLSLGATANSPVPNPLAGLLPGTTLNSANWTIGQSLLPYPQFAGVTETNSPLGKLWYDSLQIRLDKRLSRGLTMLSNYTWSKNLGASDYMNPNYDAMGSLRKALTSIDQPHLLNIAVTWQLPSLRIANRIGRAALTGWTVSGSAQFQSGSLINAPNGVFSTGIDPTATDQYWSGPSLQRWFNTCTVTTTGARQNCLGPNEPAAWIIQPSFTLANLSPRFARLRNVRPPTASISVSRDFPLTDRARFQLRGDAYNLTNTPWYGAGDNGAGVNTNASSSAFGRITFAQGNDPRTIQIGARVIF